MVEEEYREYLERYAILGQGRPKLTIEEYDRLDDELLDLLARFVEGEELSLEEEERLEELEYLLMMDDCP